MQPPQLPTQMQPLQPVDVNIEPPDCQGKVARCAARAISARGFVLARSVN